MVTGGCGRKRLLPAYLALLFVAMLGDQAWAARCLYVSSYHPGYEWNDGIERGLVSTLNGRCELKRFYMDTKRNTEPDWARRKAREAVELIASFRPDVVIAADDNASKYLVQPYFRNADIPFVFCGLNWSVQEYGYPYSNATGMVEVAPVRPLLKQIRRILATVRTGLFVSAGVTTEYKDYDNFKRILAREGVSLQARMVNTMAEWEQAYREGDRYDFVFLGNNAGIGDWDSARAEHFALQNARVLSVSSYDWMIPYAALAITKVPEEQGEWAAKVALSILDGLSPRDIPIIPNRRWQAWVNPAIVDRLRIELSPSLLLNARKYQ